MISYEIKSYVDRVVLANRIDTGEISGEAGENILQGQVVVIQTDNKFYKYDIYNSTHIGLCCGVAKTGCSAGDYLVIALPENKLKIIGSGWLTGLSYFIDASAQLSTTVPVTGNKKRIATGIAPDTIYINDYEDSLITTIDQISRGFIIAMASSL